MPNLFDINSVFFTVLDYPMSYLEFFGTVFTIWCVWLTARARVLSWPIGIAGVVLYGFLFYQIQLYSDMLEQIYFLITGFWGWWLWLHPKSSADEDANKELKISRNSARLNIMYGIIIAVGTLVLTYFTRNFHIWFPSFFLEPAAFPFLDAFTTVMSFAAQILLAKKKVESWVLWIIVDIIAVGLYWTKGVKFISLEYALFLALASKGLWSWIREYQKSEKQKPANDSFTKQNLQAKPV